MKKVTSLFECQDGNYYAQYESELKTTKISQSEFDLLRKSNDLALCPIEFHETKEIVKYYVEKKHIKKGVIANLRKAGISANYQGSTKTLYIKGKRPSDPVLRFIVDGAKFNVEYQD